MIVCFHLTNDKVIREKILEGIRELDEDLFQ